MARYVTSITHRRGGRQAGVCDDVLAPPITTHWTTLKSIAIGSIMGSMETHWTEALPCRRARSVTAARAWQSTVAPVQTLSGNSNSAKRCGNLVSIRKFHCFARRAMPRTVSIHSFGTQLPNKSAIEQVKMFFNPRSVPASFGGATFKGALNASGAMDGSNFCG